MKQDIIESILDNESIADGLDDETAQRLIQWCIEKVEASPEQDERALAEYGHHLTQQARTVAKIANHIQDGDDINSIKRRLQRLTADSAKQRFFLNLLDDSLPLARYIDTLLNIAEGG